MEYRTNGKILKGVGGLYFVKLDCADGTEADRNPLATFTVECRARGVFRHNHITPLVGDNVEVVYNDSSFLKEDGRVVPEPGGRNIMISDILPRLNSLIRPPVANIDTVFVSMAAASPEPVPETVDKLLSILEFNNIEPVVVIEKCELDRIKTDELRRNYELAGYRVFVISCRLNEGVEEIRSYITTELAGKTSAFAGASGVGKSTLMNSLFPTLGLVTSDVSRKIERGRNTTRQVELFPLSDSPGSGYIADTPGFSMIDFEHFNFFTKDDLPLTMREFSDYIGKCRYTKCTHTKEDGCAILKAVRDGRIAKSRHDSFISMYNTLKEKKEWKK